MSPYFDLSAYVTEVSEKFGQRLDSLISRGAFIRGEEVHELENTLTNYLETYSGTDNGKWDGCSNGILDGPRFEAGG